MQRRIISSIDSDGDCTGEYRGSWRGRKGRVKWSDSSCRSVDRVRTH